MKLLPLPFLATMIFAVPHSATAASSSDFHDWAPTPPMGWNSWDNFATTVTEAQTKAQADVMARDLKEHGWEYVIVDIQWYEPGAKSHAYRDDAVLTMDEYGRLQPAVNRFPSSAGGNGFKDLSKYVHEKGLKFGVHLMRGIPRQAVEKNLAVKGTNVRAQDIADTDSICPWNPDMYGVDMSKPGAQDYYDSVFDLFASWGIDYVKVDDISRPYHEHEKEIEAIRKAIDKTGRPMVLSLSPGATALSAAEHAQEHANLWRISDDFWDRWLAVREQFERLEAWNQYRIRGSWPDADMLPLGVIDLNTRRSRLTQDEQLTVMTLWSIARSPLMMGGDLTLLDPFTLSLMTNDEVLAVNQYSTANKPLFDDDGLIAWVADVPNSNDKYLALFNARDRVSLKPGEAAFTSETLSPDSDTRSVDIDVNVKGGEELFLQVMGQVDGPVPQVLWKNPMLHFADGSSRALTEYRWIGADAVWNSMSVRRDENGKAIGISGQTPSRVSFLLPRDAVRFTADAVITRWDNPSASGSGHITVAVKSPETEGPALGLDVSVPLKDLGFDRSVEIKDLWTHQELGSFEGKFAPTIPYHGAALYRVSPESGK